MEMQATSIDRNIFAVHKNDTTRFGHAWHRFFVDGKQINTRETEARIVLVDDIFRAMTRQVQYIAIHCTPKMKELNLCTNTWQNLHVKSDTKF